MHLELTLWIICTNTLTLCAGMSRQAVLAQLLKNYDPHVYPNDNEGTPTEATVQMTITDIGHMNDRAEEMELTLYLRIAWHDPKLRFENEPNITFRSIELTGDNVDKVWIPDLFFYDERQSNNHGIMGHEKLVYIYHDGNISYSERITMTTECIMDLHDYPFDSQKCILHIESYAYTTNSLVLKWAPQNEAVQSLDPNTPYFTVTGIEITSGINTWSSFAIYKEKRYFSFLNATLNLNRKSSAYGFLYFGTYPFFLSLAFLSFGLKDTIPRFTSLSTAAAGIAIQWIAVYANLPPTEHFTILDRWILMHMVMIWSVIVYNVGLHVKTTIDEGKQRRVDDKSKNLPTGSIVAGTTATDRGVTLSGGSSIIDHSTWTIQLKNGVERSFSDFYYLQTYLQAKYPDFEWPILPLQNGLTNADQLRFKHMREEYIKDMKTLLVPELWEKHSGISKTITAFCNEGHWRGGRCRCGFRLRVRIYTVLCVETTGRKTTPDILAFIFFLLMYSLFIPCVLWRVSSWAPYFSILAAFFISTILCVAKGYMMRPPKLWDGPGTQPSAQRGNTGNNRNSPV